MTRRTAKRILRSKTRTKNRLEKRRLLNETLEQRQMLSVEPTSFVPEFHAQNGGYGPITLEDYLQQTVSPNDGSSLGNHLVVGPAPVNPLVAESTGYIQADPSSPLQLQVANDPSQAPVTLIAVATSFGDLFSLDPSEQFVRNVSNEAPTELTLTFAGGQGIDLSTVDSAIEVRYSETGDFSDGFEVVPIGHAGLGNSDRDVILRFAENLEDGFYQLEITSRLTSSQGIEFLPANPEPVPGDPSATREVISFELELGGKVTSVVPQPIVRQPDGTFTPQLNQIDVYFDDVDLFRDGSTITVNEYYQLIDTRGTVTSEDDLAENPITVVRDDVDRKVTLTFADSLANLFGGGTDLRLRVGDNINQQQLPAGPDVDIQFSTIDLAIAPEPGILAADAYNVPAQPDGNWGVVLTGQQIQNHSGIQPLVDSAGAGNEPGHRDIDLVGSGGVEDHFSEPGSIDTDNSITRIPYTFLKNTPYASNSQGPLFNQGEPSARRSVSRNT